MKDDTKPGDRPKRTAQENGNADHKYMTKRELFAAMAMQGLLAAGNQNDDSLCREARLAADGLLAELAKETD